MPKWIVCAAWPYVHYVPHLGTFLHLVSADVFARYLRMRGEDVILVSGSDEHGTPIEVEAIRKGTAPRTVTDYNHGRIVEFLRDSAIAFDNYTRTESPAHIRFVQDFYKKLEQRGFVFKEIVDTPFCPRCLRSLPDRFVEGTCPHCGAQEARGDQCENCGRLLDPSLLINPKCSICGTTPQWKSSTHWFFDLPKLSHALESYIKTNPNLPENAKTVSLKWIEEGLKPRSLTRDSKWGIPAPFEGAHDKTIYVWMEAVLGYVSATIEWARNTGHEEEWKTYWFGKETKNVHFVGEDNIPFHTIIFPGLLLASGEPYVLPWQVSSTHFIQYEGRRFSRSHRIGIWIDEAFRIARPEYWRFILIALRPEAGDVNFTWREFVARVNSDLNDAIGNFVHRTLSFIWRFYKGQVPELGNLDKMSQSFVETVTEQVTMISNHLDNFRLRDALSGIVSIARGGNKFLSDNAPWHTFEKNALEAGTILHICVETVSKISILLHPFLPETSRRIWKLIGFKDTPEVLGWESMRKKLVLEGQEILEPQPVFEKIDADQLTRNIHR